MSRSRSGRFCSFVATALIGLAVLASGCAPSSTAPGNGSVAASAGNSSMLEGKTWQATLIAGLEAVPGSHVTAEFKQGKIGGNASVNSYSGPYTTASGNKITIGQLSTTLMAGSQPLMKQEQTYLAAITQATNFTVTADALALTDATGATLVKYAVVAPTALKGTQWVAVAYNNGKGGLESVAASSVITATFAEDGSLSGDAGINTYSTSYTAADSSMTIDAKIVTTSKAGPEALMTQEAAYLAALPKTAAYEIDGDELWLRDATGAALAQYRAK